MATINSASGISNMFVNNYGIKNTGMGGLMSGLDTDSLVEALTASTRAKIAKQGQDRQLLKWKQTAYRDVATTLRAFQTKRFSFSSDSTNIASERFFNTYTGASSSSAVSLLSSSTSAIGSLSISEIKQLATAEKITVNKTYGKELTGKERKFETQDFSGQTLQLKVGNGTVKTIRLDTLNGKTGTDFTKTLQNLIDKAVGTRSAQVADDTKPVDDSTRYEAGAFKDSDDNWVTHIVEVGVTPPGTGGYSMLKLSCDRDTVVVSADCSVLGLTKYQSNALEKSTLLKNVFTDMKDATYKFKINGVEIELDMANDTVEDFMTKVSSSSAGVSLTYNERTKQFVFTSKTSGAGSNILLEDVQGRFLNGFVGAYGSNNMSSSSSVINMGYDTKITNQGGGLGRDVGVEEDVAAFFADNEGKTVAFDLTVGGVTKTISFTIPAEDLDDDGVTPKGTYGGKAAIDFMRQSIQSQINSAFGQNSGITFGISASSGIEFTTTNYKEVSISATTPGSISGVDPADQLDFLDATIADMGAAANNIDPSKSNLSNYGVTGDGKITFTVEGHTVEVEYDVNGNGKASTVKALVEEINTKVRAVLGRDVITYNQGSLKLNMGLNSSGDPVALRFEDVNSGGSGASAMAKLFGAAKMDGSMDTSKHTRTAGQNAEIVIDGQVLHSETNTFKIDGLAFEVSAVHKATDAPITLISKSDPTELVEKLKEFVAEYNGILETLYTLVYEEKESGYSPLTDEQKADMTEDQITKWENEAKKGLLRNDSTIMQVINELRSTMMGKVEAAGISLYDIGIEPESFFNMTSGASYDYTKAGKLVVNETKLREFIEKDPDKVRVLFTADGGISQQLNSAINKATSSSSDPAKRGSLVRLAGTDGSTTADNTSVLGSKIDTIDKYILTLKARLESEYNRHWSKFTQLETALSRINAQSSWLADFGS